MLSNHRILLARESAGAFFETARHPDAVTLRHTESLLTRLEKECPYRHEGASLVMEVPDLRTEVVEISGLITPRTTA